MIPANVESDIFLSIPKTFTFAGAPRTIVVEKAAIANISDMVENNDVAVTISFINEKEDPELTPPNHKLARIQNADLSISYKMGAYETCVLSMNIYVSKHIRTPQVDLDGMMKAYLSALDSWYYITLRTVVEPVGRTSQDLTFLENGIHRRHLDVTVRYKVSVLTSIGTFDTVVWNTTIT
jgi:hypothetical protein